MTLPAKEHTDNFRESLKRLFETVGDTALSDRPFERTEFPDVLTTTWEDLLSKELIEHLPGTENELLTGRGWVAGLLISRQNDLQTFKQRIAALFAELKS